MGFSTTLAVFTGCLALASAFTGPACVPRAAAVVSRTSALSMDETIMEKAFAGELEEEGEENVFMSELGWAYYLDQKAQSSYNMNERFSMASDGYTTPDVFSNPFDVLFSWKDSIFGAISNPFETGFPTITNDQSGARSYPKGLGEIDARTIKPKTLNMDPKKRIVGIPGFNAFGAPSSKLD